MANGNYPNYWPEFHCKANTGPSSPHHQPASSLMVWVWSSSEQEFVSVVNLMQQPKHIKIENHVDAAAAEGSE